MNRKVLYSLLIVGLTVAAAGAGTAAFFNDTETAENNQLVAGELDLKVDWNQSYNGEWVNAWPEAENGGQADLMSRDEVAQEMFGDDYDALTEEQQMDVEEEYRGQFADLPNDVERPVIELTDVKPGDEGEVTFSLHLFDNPGWVWINGTLRENAENGVNEPEAADPDEDDPRGLNSGNDMSGELAQNVHARLFKDQNGDNEFDPAPPEPLCVELVLDNSGSMRSPGDKLPNTRDAAEALVMRLANASGDSDNLDPYTVSVEFIGSTPEQVQSSTNDTQAALDAIAQLDGSGGATNVNGSVAQAAQELSQCPDDVTKVMVIMTNGGQNTGGDARVAAQQAVDNGNVDKFITIGVRAGTSGEALLEDIANMTPPASFTSVQDLQAIQDAFDQVLVTLGGDQVIREGSIAEVLNTSGKGIPFDADTTTLDRDPVPNSNTTYVALEWSLPVDHANEIQSDSLAFDLGFYTEQARHNDGN